MDVNPEEAVIACIPVDEEAQARLRKLAEYAETPSVRVYAGSVEGVCLLCSQAIWVGPRAQAHLRQHPDTPTVCFICVIEHAQAGDVPRGSASLGNPEFDHLHPPDRRSTH